MAWRGRPVSRGTRNKRLLIVAACVVVLALGGARFYRGRQLQIDSQARLAGVAGREALAKGDYGAALDGLGRYLGRYNRRGATAEDFVLYARARRHVESPNSTHLTDAIGILRNALERDPGCTDAKVELLTLYVELRYQTEALDLVETMLVDAPGDLHLLVMKCDLLEEQRRFEPAIEVARQINAIAPQDVGAYFRTMRLLALSRAPATEIDEWVDGVMEAHATDLRFELLRASVLRRRHDDAGASKSLGLALSAVAPGKDPQFVRLLVGELDAASRFDDSLKVLEMQAEAEDVSLRRDLVLRLWFTGHAVDLAARTGLWECEGIRADPEMVALHVLALTATGRSAEAELLRKELASRGDAVSNAWSVLVEQPAGETPSQRGAVAALTAAVAAVPDSALLRQALGDAYAGLGETDLALDAWTAAAARAQAWAAPLRRIADTLVATGQEHLAPAVAKAAMLRAPNDIATMVTYLRATAALAGEMNEQQVESLLTGIRSLQVEVPEQADESLPMYLGLLSRVDKPAAEQRLREALRSTTRASETTLLRLSQIAVSIDTALEGNFLDLSESIHGITPQLALARGLARARTSGDDAGIRLIDDLRTRAPAGSAGLEWDLVRTTYADAAHRPEAGRSWIALADANPGELRAQLGALASLAAWQDRDAMTRVIDRVRQLTGEDGVTWRIARARWQLGAPAASEELLADAAKILNDVTRAAPRSTSAHVLLAQALERLGNVAGAEDQLRLASEISPDNTWIALEVARLAQRQNRPDEARLKLERVLNSKDLVPEQIERAAYLLAVQGDIRRGADLLEPLMSRAQARHDGMLLLARLYAKLGEADHALSLCQRLLSNPDAELIELTAGLYASLGRGADAEAMLARLNSIATPPGERELRRASFAASWGTQDSARDWYRRAAAAAPAREDTWTAWLSYAIATGDLASVDAILQDPKALAVEPVGYLESIRPICDLALRDLRVRALLLAMVKDRSDRTVLRQAIDLVTRDAGDPSKQMDTAVEAAALAEANVRVLPLQLVAADLCASLGMSRRACELARRASTEFPNSAAAARGAAECLARAGRWSDAVRAGLAWRDRSSGRDQVPDLFIADAQLRSGQPAEAQARLKPYVAAALSAATANADVLIDYSVSLVRCGATDDGAAKLADISRRSELCRTLAFNVEPARLGDAASAQAWFHVLDALPGPPEPRFRLMLARGWAAAWTRFGEPALLEGALRVLGEVLASPEAPAEALALAAAISQQKGDLASARRDYEVALERNPALVGVRNNLAVVLADLGEWNQAVVEATKATQSAPNSGECYDTLAYAWRKGMEFDKASAALRQAIHLEPANLAWYVSLVENLADAGRSDEAATVVTQVDAIASSGADLPDALRSRLEKVRSKPH